MGVHSKEKPENVITDKYYTKLEELYIHRVSWKCDQMTPVNGT